jgi:hypothetical protein
MSELVPTRKLAARSRMAGQHHQPQNPARLQKRCLRIFYLRRTEGLRRGAHHHAGA